VIVFDNGATAGNATLTAGGCGIYFRDDSEGGSSEITIDDSGYLDISSHNAPGITISALQSPLVGLGDPGNVFLGPNNLTINLNTCPVGGFTYNGSISDGGAGGSLTIAGCGAINFYGPLTFSGAFTVAGSEFSLQVDADKNPVYTGSFEIIIGLSRWIEFHALQNVHVHQQGVAYGGVGIRAISPASAARLVPTASNPVMTVGGDFTLDGGGTLELEIGGTDSASYSQIQVGGATTLTDGAILDLNFVNGFAPHTGDTFNLFTSGSMTGNFATVTIEGLASGFQYNLAQDGKGHLQLIALNDGHPPITLAAGARGVNSVGLTWSGATSATIDVYRNAALIRTVPNFGRYTDYTGGATYTYQVCEGGTQTCSGTVTATLRH
jgi:hypothetical protein